MIIVKVLAEETIERRTLSLLKIINDGTEVYQLRIGSDVLWFFKAYEYDLSGNLKKKNPPFELSEGKYLSALDALKSIIKIA